MKLPSVKQENTTATLACNDIGEGIAAVFNQRANQSLLLLRQHEGVESMLVEDDRAQILHSQFSPLLSSERKTQHCWPGLGEKLGNEREEQCLVYVYHVELVLRDHVEVVRLLMIDILIERHVRRTGVRVDSVERHSVDDSATIGFVLLFNRIVKD